jgi:hypothetical protein
MGLYLRLLPGVKVRVTRRGVRLGLGPRVPVCEPVRAARGSAQAGGPFSVYRPLRGRRAGERAQPGARVR